MNTENGDFRQGVNTNPPIANFHRQISLILFLTLLLLSVTTTSDHVLVALSLIMGLGAHPRKKGAVMGAAAGILLAPGREGGEMLCVGGFLLAAAGCHSGVQAMNMPARAVWPRQHTRPTVDRMHGVAPLSHLVSAISGNKGDGYKCATSVAI
jgi:hypothetical protein